MFKCLSQTRPDYNVSPPTRADVVLPNECARRLLRQFQMRALMWRPRSPFHEPFGAALMPISGYYDGKTRRACHRSMRVTDQILLPRGDRAVFTKPGPDVRFRKIRPLSRKPWQQPSHTAPGPKRSCRTAGHAVLGGPGAEIEQQTRLRKNYKIKRHARRA